MVCAVAVGSSIGSADAATTTKKKVAPTTKVRKPTEYDRRIAALKDLYARFVALDEKRLSNKTDVAIVPVEGKTILVGTAYNGMVINEKSDLAQGIYYGPLAIESLNLRVESSSATAAIMRVCQRYSTVSPKYKKDDTVAPGPVTYVTDLQISTVYSAKAKRWFISEYPHFEDVEGQSKCADGK
jgi:hypothetical protein